MRILLVVVGVATSVVADQANDWLIATSASTAAYVSQECWYVYTSSPNIGNAIYMCTCTRQHTAQGLAERNMAHR